MRRRLYGSLAVLALATAVSIAVTGLTEGHCDVICGWQWPFVFVGAGAGFGVLALAVASIAYEAWGLVAGGRRRG